MIKTLSSNAINIYIFPDVNSTSVRAYMEATFMFRLTPLCAKDDDRAPVRRAILETHAEDLRRNLHKMQPGGKSPQFPNPKRRNPKEQKKKKKKGGHN